MNASDARFLTRVRLKNYRSIGACDVHLGPLTFLVGPNGSGKSNFLDALRLVGDALRKTLDHALRDRGGIQHVRRRSGGHPTHFAIALDFRLSDGRTGHYAFKVGAKSEGGFSIQREVCGVGEDGYEVRDGELRKAPGVVSPPASTDRLYLVNAAGLPPFRAVFDALQSMGFYNLNPDRIRELQAPDTGDLLERDGRNLASVLERIERSDGGGVKHRIEEFLRAVVPGIEGVEPKRVGHMESLEFRQHVEGTKDAWRFPAINMSDGTLRALGILVALFQPRADGRVPLIGIEEPESALHPAAAGALRDCLRIASRKAQVLVTSHSPDLLDDAAIDPDALLAVRSELGETILGRVDAATRSALVDRVYTAGELLRGDQLQPDRADVPRGSQMKLFEDEERS